MRVTDIQNFMREFAPPALSESWDNTGLLLGDPQAEVRRVMTCLTITPVTVREAVSCGAEMIVSHHPMPFHALKQITAETTVGRMLRDLIRADIAVYSPHTSFDSASGGINQQIAEGLGLTEIAPLVVKEESPGENVGTGRHGVFFEPISLETCLARVKAFFSLPYVQYVGEPSCPVRKAAVGCGAAGEFIRHALRENCDLFLVGETNFHTLLEAEATGTATILLTHFASEHFACQRLADILRERFPRLAEVWGSREEKDPVRTFS